MDNFKRMWSKISLLCSTIGPIGYFPASGTFGSIIGFLFFFIFRPNLFLVISLLIISFFLTNSALRHFNKKDPSAIILDEYIGIIVALVFLPYFSFKLATGLFFLFRFFDISKPFPIYLFERLPYAFGVLADDCVAGLVSVFLIRFFIDLGIIV